MSSLNNFGYKKFEFIPPMKLIQLQYECGTWKRLLDFMMDENILLKNRISEILKNDFDKTHMEDLEGFQNRFITLDEVIAMLRNDVAKFEKLLTSELFENEANFHRSLRELKNLRNNIGIAEIQSSGLKLEFNKYLLENL